VLLRRAAPARLAQAEAEPERRKREGKRHFRKRHRAWKKAEAIRLSKLAAWTAREDARVAVGTPIGFTGFHDSPIDGEIAVATDSPWVLGRVTAPVRIATYGDTPGAMNVLVDVLLGRASAPGQLPVTVSGVERRGCP
jgi:beta-N-acetylhexosaminidase